VLYQEAKRKGLDKNKEIQAKIEDAGRAILIDTLLEEGIEGKKGKSQKRRFNDTIKRTRPLFKEPQE